MTEYSVKPLGLREVPSILDFRKSIALGKFPRFARLSFWQKAKWW